MRARTWALVLAPLLLGAGPAAAQGGPYGSSSGYDPDVTGSLRGPPGPVVNPATGQICQRWCQWDDVPCDPPSFKIADGRCRGRNSFR